MDAMLLVFAALLAVMRELRLPTLWALPMDRGPGWLFDARVDVGSAAARKLIRSYRAWLIATSAAVEAAAATDLLLSGAFDHLVWVHAPLTLALGLARRMIVRRFVLEARDLAPQPARTTVSFSLRPRRLRDFTSRGFELANAALTAAGLAVILIAAEGTKLLPSAWIVWCAMGGLLWKVSLLRRPVPLPAERSEEYLGLVDEAFRGALRSIDVLRGSCTAALCLIAARAVWPAAWLDGRSERIAFGLAALLVVVGTAVPFVRESRRIRSLAGRARQLGVLPPALRLLDPQNLRLGGWLYGNRDNPSVVVNGGPLRAALNVSNRGTWIYVGYWVTFAILIVFLAVR